MKCTKHNRVFCGIQQFYNIFVLFYNKIVKLYVVDGRWTVIVGI